MQSGRIAPLMRNFFNSVRASSTNSDAGSQQNFGGQADREPTEEEARAALAILTNDEEIKKSALTAELIVRQGRLTIEVCNSGGTVLKALRGLDILRLLVPGAHPGQGNRAGRILDRRI